MLRRGKKIVNLLLAVAIVSLFCVTAVQTVSAVGPSNQKIEFQNGNTERVYPTLIAANPGECGSDSNDIILQYSTYWGPRVDPDNVRWGSNSNIMNFYLSQVFYRSGLSANGLGSTTTRVCMGSRGQIFGPDALEMLYIWHR